VLTAITLYDTISVMYYWISAKDITFMQYQCMQSLYTTNEFITRL